MEQSTLHRFKQGYLATVYEFTENWQVTYYINRSSSLNYSVLCRVSGCGTDRITSGTLGQCYRAIKQCLLYGCKMI